MRRDYIWLKALVGWLCCVTVANAIEVYDDGGVHEVSTKVFEDIHVFDSPTQVPTTLIVLEGADTHDIDVFGHSMFHMKGGEIGDGSLSLHDFSRGEISGGIMRDNPLDLYDQSQLHITDSFDSDDLRTHHDSKVFIYGTNFNIDGVPAAYGEIGVPVGMLTGTMPNGQLELFFNRMDNATITLVPEPAELSLLAMGTLWVRKKQRQNAITI